MREFDDLERLVQNDDLNMRIRAIAETVKKEEMNDRQVQKLVDSVLQKVREASQGEDGYVPSKSVIDHLTSLVTLAVEAAGNVGEVLLILSKWAFTVEEVFGGVRFLASIAWDMSRGDTDNETLQLRWQAYLEHVVCTSLSLASVKVVLFVFDQHLKKFDRENLEWLLEFSKSMMPQSSRAASAHTRILQFRSACSARGIIGMLRYHQEYVSAVWKLAGVALLVSQMLNTVQDPSLANAVRWTATYTKYLR
eukprot:2110257-Rhodomonas_salina.1